MNLVVTIDQESIGRHSVVTRFIAMATIIGRWREAEYSAGQLLQWRLYMMQSVYIAAIQSCIAFKFEYISNIGCSMHCVSL